MVVGVQVRYDLIAVVELVLAVMAVHIVHWRLFGEGVSGEGVSGEGVSGEGVSGEDVSVSGEGVSSEGVRV